MTTNNTPTPTTLDKAVTGIRKMLLRNPGINRKRQWVDYAFIIAFVILIFITASMSDVFFTQQNLSNLLRQTVTNGLLSLGMLVVILTGGIDLSVGPIVALTGIIVAGLSKQGMPLLPAILICIAVGIAVGAVNGFFIARFQTSTIHRNTGYFGNHPGFGICVF